MVANLGPLIDPPPPGRNEVLLREAVDRLRLRQGHGGKVMVTSVEERFWAKVNKDGPVPQWRSDLGACWLWTGTINWGYGVFRANGHQMRAHRFAYELLVGPIPEGLQIDHLCRVRRCVNPEHLEPVTGQENVRRGASYAKSLKPRRLVPQPPSPYGNPRRDPRTGRFVGRFASLQTLRQLADLPEHEWDLDDEAMAILEGGIALAIADGWTPPASSEATP